VVNNGNSTIGEYNASNGTAINASLVSGLAGPSMIAFAPAAVPEPASITMLVIGIADLAGYRGWRRRQPLPV
jgi:hypothetical protein